MLDGIGDQAFQGRYAAVVGERPHLGICVKPVADPDRLGAGREAFGERVGEPLLHEKARRRHADLPGIAELVGHHQVHGEVEIGILGDDDRRMPAELHGRALHMRAGERCKLLADRSRSGEANLADDRMRDEVFRDLSRNTIDEIDDAGRDAGVGKGLDEGCRRSRRFLRRLDDDRAAGGERCREFAHHLVDRKIPWREGGDRSDWLLQGNLHAHPARAKE